MSEPITTAKTQTDRFDHLSEAIADYESVKKTILTGIDDEERILRQKKRILHMLGAGESEWNDYRWQLANRITGAEAIRDILGLSDERLRQIQSVQKKYRFGVSPYYLSLISPGDEACPILRQAIPSGKELSDK
ncbi:MAG: lysine 2,3-aminomutase, partial [Christensenellales bacterium]